MSPARSLVTSHVLDTARGVPAAGVPVRLERADQAAREIARAVTDQDGRVSDLGPERLPPGRYRLVFETGDYLAGAGAAAAEAGAGAAGTAFFPEVAVTFLIGDEPHYHVPLLLSPFAYTTYRGS